MFGRWASATTFAASACFSLADGIVDPNQDGAGCDVLPANDGNFPNPAVDACGEIEHDIDLALNEERFWP